MYGKARNVGNKKKKRKQRPRDREGGKGNDDGGGNNDDDDDDNDNDNVFGTKRSILFDLEYWEHNLLRHSLDVITSKRMYVIIF